MKKDTRPRGHTPPPPRLDRNEELTDRVVVQLTLRRATPDNHTPSFRHARYVSLFQTQSRGSSNTTVATTRACRALAPGVADARLFTTRGYRSLSSPLSSPPSFDRHAHRFPSPPHPLPVYPCVTRRRQERDARAGDCRLLGRRARAGNARHYHDVHHDYGFCGN